MQQNSLSQKYFGGDVKEWHWESLAPCQETKVDSLLALALLVTVRLHPLEVSSVCATNDGAAIALLQALRPQWHGLLKTPFDDGEPYWCGFTERGASGFNGQPDYYAAGSTLALAICRAALLTKGIAVSL